MTAKDSSARERIVAGAADMISRRGLSATSIRQMARHAGAPLGSTYHYFPDGKPQLAAEAVRHAGRTVAQSLGRELRAGPDAGLRAFLDRWRAVLLDSGYRVGCPVLAVAIEEPAAGERPAALDAAAEVFGTWEALLAASLREHGAPPERAEDLATLIVAAVEGAVAMCRAQHSTAPLDRTADRLQVLVRDAVGG